MKTSLSIRCSKKCRWYFSGRLVWQVQVVLMWGLTGKTVGSKEDLSIHCKTCNFRKSIWCCCKLFVSLCLLNTDWYLCLQPKFKKLIWNIMKTVTTASYMLSLPETFSKIFVQGLQLRLNSQVTVYSRNNSPLLQQFFISIESVLNSMLVSQLAN